MSSLRKFLLKHVVRSTKLTQAVQKYRTPLFDALMKFCTELGGLAFYILFIPTLAWVLAPLGVVPLLDQQFAFDFSFLLFFLTVFASALKDIFNLPRPTHVWQVKRETDRGFPSSHSMNCIAMWTFALRRLDLTPQQHATLVGVACVWIALVAFSRLYNGVHSYPDIIAGLVFGYALGVLFSSALVLQLQLLRGWSAVALAVLSVAIFPRPPTISASRCLGLASLMLGTTLAKFCADHGQLHSAVSHFLAAAMPDWMRNDLRLPWVPTVECSVARVAIHRFVFGLGALGVTFVGVRVVSCVAVDCITFVLRKLNVNIEQMLANSIALPTAAYKKLSAKQAERLRDEKHKTRHYVLSTFYVILFTLYIAPTVFPLMKATKIGDCVAGVPRF